VCFVGVNRRCFVANAVGQKESFPEAPKIVCLPTNEYEEVRLLTPRSIINNNNTNKWQVDSHILPMLGAAPDSPESKRRGAADDDGKKLSVAERMRAMKNKVISMFLLLLWF
jgi:hypothetical protein